MTERCMSRPSSQHRSEPDVSETGSSVAVAVREEGARTPLVGRRDLPYGPQPLEYIYVLQNKPAPMAPLKVGKLE